MTYFNEFGQARLGWRTSASGGGGSTVDTDAQAFITAANITDSTQKSAINTLVTQLKTYGIWTKLKAVYPFVGGTASSHKFNLKDPRDLDAAYRLVFNGGWTHSSTGALPNGTTAFANTYLTPNTNLTQWNTHLSYYSRTSTRITNTIEIGSYDGTSSNLFSLILPRSNGLSTSTMYSQALTTDEARTTTATDASGLFIGTRTSNTANTHKLFRNGAVIGTASTSAGTLLSNPLYIGAMRTGASAGAYSNKESAFASIGDGLTDAEAANFYTAVQTFQTTLGRQVGVPIVADSDAQAFLNAAVITNQTQANAINTLVTDLKAANIWTKMKAIYPFVGGTASSHKFNLKDPRDLDAAYRLVFNGGWTHSSTGALPNGTTAFANTYLAPNAMGQNSVHISVYSRTNVDGVYADIYGEDGTKALGMIIKNGGISRMYLNTLLSDNISNSNPSTGLFVASRTASATSTLFQNGTKIITGTRTSLTPSTFNVYLGAGNYSGTPSLFSIRQQAFASIGDGLTDAEATAFYNAVQAYQTTLGRQI